MVDIRIATLALLTAATPLQARVISFEIEKQSAYGRFEGIDFQRIEANGAPHRLKRRNLNMGSFRDQ